MQYWGPLDRGSPWLTESTMAPARYCAPVSAENLELVRRLYRAMNNRDVAGAAQLIHPEAEWISDARTGERPVRSRDMIVGYFTDMADSFEQLLAEIDGIWAQDDQVLAFVHLVGRGLRSGADVDIRIAHLVTLRDGLVVRGEAYGNRDEALAAAGVVE
jgi:ketosteroid isomerase-like protein